MDDEQQSEDLGKLWQGVGRVDDREPAARELLIDLYGANARGGVDAKAAAAELGVSERTVRRWAKDGIPEHAKGAAVREGHREWRNSPDGREAKMNTRRESRLRNKGTTIKFNGRIKISGDNRHRKVNIPLDGEAMSDILDALLAGNDDAARDALNDAFADFFGGDVDFDLDALETFG